MTGPEHYREAERILTLATRENDRLSRTIGPIEQITAEQRAVANMVAIGNGHATLALAAATALCAVDVEIEAAHWREVLR